jgi:hypothetical protein
MCAALRKWADRLRDENSTLAESLAGYADAWEAERARAAELIEADLEHSQLAADLASRDAMKRIAEQDEEIARLRSQLAGTYPLEA